MNSKDIKMMTPFTKVLLLIIGVGLLAAIYLMIFGHGASTNLNDMWPWGFMICGAVLGGVAMAAGGFVIAGMVYLLNWKKYKPIVRPAILTSFFGYLMAATSIFLDIGHHSRIWHPIVMWQINSIMFIVAIHVVLYTTTLATESSPMIFEKLNMKKALNFVNKIMVPIVLFGVLLSILHQSSLGAVYLIVPSKLSPLWYSSNPFSNIPMLFLVSAVMMGLSMVSFITIVSTKAFKHKPPMEILTGLAGWTMIVGSLYFVLKMWNLITEPGIGAAFDGSVAANMYLIEIIIGIILPLTLLSRKGLRNRLNVIFTANILVIIGIIVNRFNVGIFGLAEYTSRSGFDYFPSWIEIALVLALLALAVFGFKVSAKYLNLFPEASQ
jgi:Ni/Fe-hydrogenase subunit HybB-like protein